MCTGEVSPVVPSAGPIRIGGRLLQEVVGIENVAWRDSTGGHPPKSATKHHTNEPPRRRRVRTVTLGSAVAVGDPPVCTRKTAKLTGTLTRFLTSFNRGAVV